mmetsp:Transcript_52839/g.78748  ORF Transcript_52839/g.78748 Transcript_52839/m.78748 type:complete len:1000 (-) Transcript_52839:110-3109(-)
MDITDTDATIVRHDIDAEGTVMDNIVGEHTRSLSEPPITLLPHSRQNPPFHGSGKVTNSTSNPPRSTSTVGPTPLKRAVTIDNSQIDKVDRAMENSIVATAAVVAPNIDDGSPAAEALRANAGVQVTKLDKFARAVGTQSVKRMGKRVTRVVQLKTSSGDKRGKPPRVPPGYDPEHRKGLAGPGGGLVDEKIFAGIGVYGESLAHLGTLQEIDDETSQASAPERLTTSAAGRISPLLTPASLNTSIMSVPKEISLDDSPVIDDPELFGDIMVPNTKTPVTGGDDMRLSYTENVPMGLDDSHHREDLRTQLSGANQSTSFSERMRKRRKKKERTKYERRSSYVKGKVIDREHELYTLSIAVMLGLRTSIGMTNSELSDSEGQMRWLDEDDFRAVEKYVFRPKGGPRTPPHQLSHTFKFKDYSPQAFAYIRRMFGINEYEFLLSVCGNANFIEFISNAKSGQFFFYSSDGKYMIKTMTNAESKFLRRILPHYFRHCAQYPNTLITKFFGMYRVKMYHLRRNVKFVIMNSVFDTDKFLQSFYDLKGSKINRDAKPGEDVKKDNDVRRGLPGSAFALPPVVRQELRRQLEADCTFFKEMKIMDYSMLIGVHHIPPKAAPRSVASFRDQSSGRKDANSIRDLLGKRANAAHPIPALPFQLVSPDPDRENSGEIEVELDEDSFDTANRQRGTTVNSRVSVKKSPGAGGSLSPRLYNNDMQSIDDKLLEGEGDFSVLSFNTYEQYFDDDEDWSYLDGAASSQRNLNELHFSPSADSEADSAQIKKRKDVEFKMEEATKQMFWPFHRLYNIQGRRRMVPLSDEKETQVVNGNEQEKQAKWVLPDFVKPISDRKDGGLMMDVSGLELPIKLEGMGRTQLCEGKIFYMGIIDVLQQFNTRKRFEARWRRLRGGGWGNASCVHPNFYADRFLRFFDEYSTRNLLDVEDKEGSAKDDEASDSDDGVEEITFYDDAKSKAQKTKDSKKSGTFDQPPEEKIQYRDSNIWLANK